MNPRFKNRDDVRIRPTPMEMRAHYVLIETPTDGEPMLALSVKHGPIANWAITLPAKPAQTMHITINRGPQHTLPGTSTYNMRAGDVVHVLLHGAYPPQGSEVAFVSAQRGWRVSNLTTQPTKKTKRAATEGAGLQDYLRKRV